MQKLVPTKYKITIDPKNLQPHAIKCNGEHTFEMTPEQFTLEKLEKISVKLPLMQKKHCRFPSSYHGRKSRKSLRSGVCILFFIRPNQISKPVSCSSVTSLNLQVSAGIRERFPLVASATCRPTPKHHARKKKPLIPKVPVKKTNAEYLNYYPIAMLVFFRSSLVSSISRLSDK